MSNGSGVAPNPPLAFDGPVDGVWVADAEVQPPKSSSAVMAGVFFDDDIGSPQAPEMSLGVMREGGLPMSTVTARGLAEGGSGAPHALSLPEDHGSNMVELFEETVGGTLVAAIVALGGGAVVVERLKAELMRLLGGGGTGVETFVGGGTGGGAGIGDAKPENSSDENKSFEIAGIADLVVVTGA